MLTFSHVLMFTYFALNFWYRNFRNNSEHLNKNFNLQKQPSRRVPTKRCYGNMQQFYSGTPIQSKFIEIKTSEWMFSCKFAAYFQNCWIFKRRKSFIIKQKQPLREVFFENNSPKCLKYLKNFSSNIINILVK